MMTKVNHFLIFRFGVSSVFVTGCVMLCVSTLLFSLLSIIEDVTLFLTLAYIFRVVEGVAGAILWPAMLAPILRRYRWTFNSSYCLPFIVQSFPQNSGLVYSVIEATFGLGYTLGPVLGAFLYQAGGFNTPFLVCGAAISVTDVTYLDNRQSLVFIIRLSAVCVYVKVLWRSVIRRKSL